MAYCKFISKIKKIVSQSKVVEYVENEKKTLNPGYAQSTAINYITNEEKTKNKEWLKAVFNHPEENAADEKEFFVTGIMCSPDNAHQQMLEAQKMSDKPVVNYAYHAVQSFKEGPGEITPEVAHEVGVRLAQELWGDKFMVLVATHLNTDHYHNHFIICSTSPITGKRFHKCDKTLWKMRNKSDELCREYGLHTIDNSKQ